MYIVDDADKLLLLLLLLLWSLFRNRLDKELKDTLAKFSSDGGYKTWSKVCIDWKLDYNHGVNYFLL